MTAMNEIVHIIEPGADDDRITRGTAHDDGPKLGEWYWVQPDEGSDEYDKPEAQWLGCAMKVGSNYVEIQSPHSDRGYTHIRVHFDNFVAKLRHEPKAEQVIRAQVGMFQGEAAGLMNEIEEVTRRLGMTPQGTIGPASNGDAGGALMVLSTQHDPKAYSTALTVAKEKTLPALFEALKVSHSSLAKWMKAPVMSMLAQMRDQKEIVTDIDDRIFSVSLYAGLTEETIQVADGEPAEILDKLHVMQRMAFMDEECLANYKHGGMDFNGIDAFDSWLAEPENRDRILPFPRTLVAFRVRRNRKHRDWQGSVATLQMNFEKEKQDQLTFLYVRNGAQLWRVSTEIDFGDLIFPDASVFDPSEPKMAEMFGRTVKGFVSRHWWEGERDRQLKSKADAEAWHKDPANTGKHSFENPHREWFSRSYKDYQPVDSSSVYYDDAMGEIGKKIKEYNRVALIIQGLFDRSMCLHPHLPAKTWTAAGFDRAVKLVYDGTGTLYNGEAPDFEAYRARCNKSMRIGSMTVGQDDFWMRAEAEKESSRRDRDSRSRSEYRPETYRPHGNPGPGHIARVEKLTKGGKATFTWARQRLKDVGYWQRNSETIPCSITVPTEKLFNIDGYKMGDFKQFFADPRTRARYLVWAPILIAAEERLYQASKATT